MGLWNEGGQNKLCQGGEKYWNWCELLAQQMLSESKTQSWTQALTCMDNTSALRAACGAESSKFRRPADVDDAAHGDIRAANAEPCYAFILVTCGRSCKARNDGHHKTSHSCNPARTGVGFTAP
jgi:hypothetical protein